MLSSGELTFADRVEDFGPSVRYLEWQRRNVTKKTYGSGTPAMLPHIILVTI